MKLLKYVLPLTVTMTLASSVGIADQQEPLDLDMVGRILDEGYLNSEIMDNVYYLTDRIGSRLTGSPAMTEANEWTAEKLEEYGLESSFEAFPFGNGWTFERSIVRMTAPRLVQLDAYPLSWTAGTDGVLEAEAILAPMNNLEDARKYEGQLEGKIVMISAPTGFSQPSNTVFKRWSDEELADSNYTGPSEFGSPFFTQYIINMTKVVKYVEEQGAVAVIAKNFKDGGLLGAQTYMYRPEHNLGIPGIALASEDYNRAARLINDDATVRFELDVDVTFYPDQQVVNTLADIPGGDLADEVVMAGAHLDSWYVADGAVDNAAGVAVMMEAARILKALDVQPRRTIRIALWSGEEQALIGSIRHVQTRYASRSEPGPDEEHAGEYDWFSSGEVTKLPDYDNLAAYFNYDSGSGRIRGVYAQENFAVMPIFRRWLEPFHDLGAATVQPNSTSGSDYEAFQWVGLPGFPFIQDPLDYSSRLHHTQVDTADHVVEDDLKQAAAIIASFLYHAAMRDDPLPRESIR